jgi:hypothetical protein
MLSKIQTDTRLSGRLLDQGLGQAKPQPCVLELVCAFEAPLQSTTLALFFQELTGVFSTV